MNLKLKGMSVDVTATQAANMSGLTVKVSAEVRNEPEVLKTVVPQLRFVPAPQPAQLRLWAGDVTQALAAPQAGCLTAVC